MTATQHRDEPQKHNVGLKKKKRRTLLYDSIYMKFQTHTKLNQCLAIYLGNNTYSNNFFAFLYKVKTVVSLRGVTGKD